MDKTFKTNSGRLKVKVEYLQRAIDSSKEPINSILIPETRETMNRKTLYVISVSGQVKAFSIMKRFSEFDQLDRELNRVLPLGDIQLPPKRLTNVILGGIYLDLCMIDLVDDQRLVAERRVLLEKYLNDILGHTNPIWKRSRPWLEFFNLPLYRQEDAQESVADNFNQYKWIQDLESLQSFSAQIRSVLNERDRHIQQGNNSLVHTICNKRL